MEKIYLLIKNWLKINWKKKLPKIAITVSSFIISKEPLAIKYKDVSTSPLCSNVSPGGAWVVLNFNDNALKHQKC